METVLKLHYIHYQQIQRKKQSKGCIGIHDNIITNKYVRYIQYLKTPPRVKRVSRLVIKANAIF